MHRVDYPRLDGPVTVNHEYSDWGVDPDSGAIVRRLTSAAAHSNNIYCEKPLGSPDGTRLLVARWLGVPPSNAWLYVADLKTGSLTLVETDLAMPDQVNMSVANVPWSEWKYYNTVEGSIRRLSLVTLERQQVRAPGTLRPQPLAYLESITPDESLLIGAEFTDERGRQDFSRQQGFTLDLKTGVKQVIHPGERWSHEQFNPGGAGEVLHLRYGPGPSGRWAQSVVVRRLDGGEPVRLPFGDPWSAEQSGHIAWLGKTGRVISAANWLKSEKRHDPRHPAGNLLVATPGDRTPAVFPAPGHAFYHVSSSRCGRYFVGDDVLDFRADAFASGYPGPIRIVIGNLETGKSRVLLRDCQHYGICGRSPYEPNPYLTADNRNVIYNAAPFGLMQVFAAEVPEAFWRSLD